jgi:multidrug efflux system outer membrane protein
VSYLDVIDSQRQVLQSQLQASHLEGTQAVSTVNLIRALGGGWGDMPASDAPVAGAPVGASAAGVAVVAASNAAANVASKDAQQQVAKQ